MSRSLWYSRACLQLQPPCVQIVHAQPYRGNSVKSCNPTHPKPLIADLAGVLLASIQKHPTRSVCEENLSLADKVQSPERWPLTSSVAYSMASTWKVYKTLVTCLASHPCKLHRNKNMDSGYDDKATPQTYRPGVSAHHAKFQRGSKPLFFFRST